MSDLVKRAERELVESEYGCSVITQRKLIDEIEALHKVNGDQASVVTDQSEQIEALRAERDRYKTALEPFARVADMEFRADPASSVMVNVDRCRDARQALKGTRHD